MVFGLNKLKTLFIKILTILCTFLATTSLLGRVFLVEWIFFGNNWIFELNRCLNLAFDGFFYLVDSLRSYAEGSYDIVVYSGRPCPGKSDEAHRPQYGDNRPDSSLKGISQLYVALACLLLNKRWDFLNWKESKTWDELNWKNRTEELRNRTSWYLNFVEPLLNPHPSEFQFIDPSLFQQSKEDQSRCYVIKPSLYEWNFVWPWCIVTESNIILTFGQELDDAGGIFELKRTMRSSLVSFHWRWFCHRFFYVFHRLVKWIRLLIENVLNFFNAFFLWNYGVVV